MLSHPSYTRPLQAATAAEIPKVCKLERFENTTQMGNQPTNVNSWNEWDEWVDFPTEEEPHGESQTNVGNFASTVQPTNDWEFILEMESKWMVINDASELSVAR